MSSEQSNPNNKYFELGFELVSSDSSQKQDASSGDQDLSNMPKYLAQAPWYLPQGDVVLFFG